MENRSAMVRVSERLVLWKKPLYMALIACICVAILYFALRPSAIPVDLADIQTGPITVSVQEEGVSRVRDIFVVSAPISGKLLRSPLKVGDTVTKERTLVATLMPLAPSFLDVRSRRAAQAAVRAAVAAAALTRANVAKTRAELEFANAELVRAERLIQRDTISQRTLDQARLKVKTTEAVVNTTLAELNVREQELISARASLIEPSDLGSGGSSGVGVDVYAPVTGRVLHLAHESEKVVAAGSPLIELGNPRDLEIVADFLSSDAVRLKEGASALILQWGGRKALHARVRRIEPTGFKKVSALGIEEQRVKIRLDLTDPHVQWSLLGHDYRVHVQITVWQTPKATLIPLGALFRKGDQWATFRVQDGQARLKLVTIGQQNKSIAEVTAGLSAGERVILHPSDRITDGTRIVERAALN